MNRSWLVSVVLLVLVLSGVSPPILRTPTAVAAETKGCTVYITKSGARYHRAGCSSLRKSAIPMSRAEAVRRGLTPCRRCGGSDCEGGGEQGVAASPPSGSGPSSPPRRKARSTSQNG